MSSRRNILDESNYVRERLFGGEKKPWRRYAELVIGETSLWKLLRYELIVMFVIPVPGALGLALRRLFCPMLFQSVGRSPIFGRDIVLRNAGKITLGDNVVLDDHCVLDARGAGSCPV